MSQPDDRWIADGIAHATRLKEQGLINQAADVLAYVERNGLGRTKLDRKRAAMEAWRAVGCSVKDCDRLRSHKGGPYCLRHRPRFDVSEPQSRALLTAMWCTAMHLPVRRMRRAA